MCKWVVTWAAHLVRQGGRNTGEKQGHKGVQAEEAENKVFFGKPSWALFVMMDKWEDTKQKELKGVKWV